MLTLIIAGYVLHQASTLLPKTIHILMQGTPEGISINEVISAMENITGVDNVHHAHIWQLDEHQNALEAHVVITDLSQIAIMKTAIKNELSKQFVINHSTLELEESHCEQCGC